MTAVVPASRHGSEGGATRLAAARGKGGRTRAVKAFLAPHAPRVTRLAASAAEPRTTKTKRKESPYVQQEIVNP